MNKILPAIFLIIVLASPAIARIGERERDFKQRYGKQINSTTNSRGKVISYKSDTYDIQAIFRSGIAVSVTYSIQGSALSIQRIEHLLHKNDALNRSKNVWYINGIRSDGAAVMFTDREGRNSAAYDFMRRTLTITSNAR